MGVERAHVGIQRVLANYGLNIVFAVIGLEGANDSKLVCQPGELAHRLAEVNTGDGSLHGVGHGANFARCLGLWVKRFELAGSSLLKEEDHGLAGGVAGASLGRRQQGREAQSTKTEGSRRKKATATNATR